MSMTEANYNRLASQNEVRELALHEGTVNFYKDHLFREENPAEAQRHIERMIDAIKKKKKIYERMLEEKKDVKGDVDREGMKVSILKVFLPLVAVAGVTEGIKKEVDKALSHEG